MYQGPICTSKWTQHAPAAELKKSALALLMHFQDPVLQPRQVTHILNLSKFPQHVTAVLHGSKGRCNVWQAGREDTHKSKSSAGTWGLWKPRQRSQLRNRISTWESGNPAKDTKENWELTIWPKTERASGSGRKVKELMGGKSFIHGLTGRI